MSLINQVLNDLDKRGAAKASAGDATIRVVPTQPKSSLWLYIILSILLVGIITTVWMITRKPWFKVQPVALVDPLPVAKVLTITHPAISSELQTPFSDVRLFSSETQQPHPNPMKVRVKPVSSVVLESALASQALLNLHPPRAEVTNKQLKKETPQQQAENEFRKAYLLAQQGQWADAASGYRMALSLDPTHVMAREALVAVLQESKHYPEAESVLKEALVLDIKQTHFAMLLARLQVERNEVALALETLEKTLPYAERMADYQAFIAALFQRQGQHKEAIAYYQKALEMSPVSVLWLMGLGISMQADHQNEAALETYKRAIDSRSLSPELQAFVEQRIKEIKPKDNK